MYAWQFRIFQEPEALYGDIKVLPLEKLDRSPSEDVLREFIQEEELKQVSIFIMKWSRFFSMFLLIFVSIKFNVWICKTSFMAFFDKISNDKVLITACFVFATDSVIANSHNIKIFAKEFSTSF